MPELERYMLARLAELDGIVRKAYEASISAWSTRPCSTSAPTICRPSISTSARTRSIAIRRPARVAAAPAPSRDEIFRRIVTWFAPILCFTMEEAWTTRFGRQESVHLNDFFRRSPAMGKARPHPEMESHPRTAPRRHRRAGSGRAPTRISAPAWKRRRSCSVTDPPDKAPVRYGGPDRGRDHLAVPRSWSLPDSDDLYAVQGIAGGRRSRCAATGEKCARCWMVLDVKAASRHPPLQPLHRCGRGQRNRARMSDSAAPRKSA